MEPVMKCHVDFLTIKSGKRNDPQNEITAAFLALKEAIQKSPHTYVENSDEAEVVFVFGSITQRKLDTERAQRIVKHRLAGKKILALDTGLFSTYIRNGINRNETGFFRIGLGDVTGEGNFLNENSTNERYEWFKETFKFKERQPSADHNKPILFILQSERGWQYDNQEPFFKWAQDTVDRIRSITSRKIVLRAHPNIDRNPTEWIARRHANIGITHGDRSRRTVIDAIRESSAVVTHSSSAAVESIVEGIPTFALDKRCVAWEACSGDLTGLIHAEDFDWSKREQILNNWAMTSWNVEELKNPNLIEYYMEKIK